MVSCPLARLPIVMREKLSHVVLHSGNETAFAEDKGNFFVLYSENMEIRAANKDLDETVFHESVHATLDYRYLRSKEWRAAQANDNAFITKYAMSNPGKEDMAESALFVYALLKYPGRLPVGIETWLRTNLPNRIEFFGEIFNVD